MRFVPVSMNIEMLGFACPSLVRSHTTGKDGRLNSLAKTRRDLHTSSNQRFTASYPDGCSMHDGALAVAGCSKIMHEDIVQLASPCSK